MWDVRGTTGSGEAMPATMAELDYASLLRSALLRSYALLRERDPWRLRKLVLHDTVDLLGASLARFYDIGPDGGFAEVRVVPRAALPAVACEIEAELLTRALARGKSLISSHPLLDRDLVKLAEECRVARITTHVLLLRAYQETYGAVAAHWVGKERPVDYDGRSVFYAYWDNAGLAVATAYERAQANAELADLRRSAFEDRLTGLPNETALQRQLELHGETFPFSVLMLDFDGLSDANKAFGYFEGGNVLIKEVAVGLAGLALSSEFVARMHTGGDEFVLLLPGVSAEAAARRSSAVERGLETLDVPVKFERIYLGASVGHATRLAGETPGQTLGRAIDAMRVRKSERNSVR